METPIRTVMLALAAVLGVPAVVYFGLRGPLSAELANLLAFGSFIIALAIVALLLWHDR